MIRKRSARQLLTRVALCLASLSLCYCASSDEEAEGDLEVSEEFEDGEEFAENNEENFSDENIENNDNLNDQGFNNQDFDNQEFGQIDNDNLEGFNNENLGLNNQAESTEGNAFNENPGLNDFAQNEDDLQQIVSNVDGNAGENFTLENDVLEGNEALGFENNLSGNPDNFGNQDFANDLGAQGVDNTFAPAGDVPVTAGALPEMGAKMLYTVVVGDTLGSIAAKIYGDQTRWREIAELTGLENPNRIFPGDVVFYQLTQESQMFAQNYESATRGEVIVQPGDSLSAISSRVYGSPIYWKTIWRENDTVDNPDRLEVGQTLYYLDNGFRTAALEASELFQHNGRSPVDTKLPVAKDAQDSDELKSAIEGLKLAGFSSKQASVNQSRT